MLRRSLLLLCSIVSVCALAETPRGTGVVVAMIDSGVDTKHPALRGKVIGGWDYVDDDADPYSQLDVYGTSTARVIAGDDAGLAPGAKLLAYRVVPYGASADTADAIDRAVRDGADVILVGFIPAVSADDDAVFAAIRATHAGVVVIAPVGNGGPVTRIASEEDVIAVGAWNPDPELWLGLDSAAGPTRGPFPLLKPDVAAPGVVNLGPGAVFTGTPAAAAQVAGIAARLLETHPQWTPQEVKTALMNTAQEIDATPFERGAGLVDTHRAEEDLLSISDTGMFFGTNPEESGYWRRAAILTIENRSMHAETLVPTATRLPDGASMTFWPPGPLEVPPGERRELRAELQINNEIVGFEELRLGGDVVLTGSSTWRVPWAVLRGARVRMSAIGRAVKVTAIGHGRRYTAYEDKGHADLYLPPGTYDFTTTSCYLLECYVRVLEQHRITSDTLDLNFVPAMYPVELAAHDAEGHRLADLPRSQTQAYAARWTMQCPGCDPHEALGYDQAKFFISKTSERFTFNAVETYFDLENNRAFRVTHQFRGIAGTITSQRDLPDYVQARVTWPAVKGAVYVCATDWFSGESIPPPARNCAARSMTGDLALDYFATQEADDPEPIALRGLRIVDDDVISPVIRTQPDGFLLSWMPVPSVVSPRVAFGDTMAFKQGPLHPFGFASYANYQVAGGLTAFRGPLEEVYRDFTWTITTPDGVTGSGTGGLYLPDYYYFPYGGRLEARHGDAHLTLVKKLDESTPSFTSARFVDAMGRSGRLLWHGRARYLQFSVTDPRGLAPLPREKVRASWRRTGTSAWTELPVMFVGSEVDKPGKMPVGEIFRADLVGVPAGEIDLRMESEDAMGNTVAFTQTLTVPGPSLRGAERGPGEH